MLLYSKFLLKLMGIVHYSAKDAMPNGFANFHIFLRKHLHICKIKVDLANLYYINSNSVNFYSRRTKGSH